MKGSHDVSSIKSFIRTKMASLDRENRLGPATAPNGNRVRR